MRPLIRLIFGNILGNLVRLFLWPFRPRPRWVKIKLDGPLPSRPMRQRFLAGAKEPSLAELADLGEGLGGDARVEGLIVELEELSGGWAHAQSVRDILAKLVAKGKRVIVHLSSPSLRDLHVATAATSILVDESGPLAFHGMSAEALFWARALGKAGVRAQMEFRGEYKSMGETFTREDMSPAHREALDAVMDRLHADVVDGVAASRKITRERAAELVEGGPYTAAEAARLGLVDAVCYADEIPGWAQAGKPVAARVWRRSRSWRPRWKPLLRPREIAVVPLHGMVVGGEGSGGRSFGARAATRALTAVREDSRVLAAVLHIDSRGGAAAASDLIWREVRRLAAKKPVVAYMHDVAASGGYYIACAATKIVAQPGTLTGSIGVVAGKLSVAGLLEKAGVNAVLLRRGEASGMMHPTHDYTDEERRRLRAEVDALYDQFVRKVASGRGLSVEAAEAQARGRVWVGSDAHARGLVDELGDAGAAVHLARALAGPPAARAEVVEHPVIPRRRSLLARALATAAPAAPAAPAPLEELLALAGERLLLVAPAITVE